MIHYGYARATMDIELLVRPDPENIERIRRTLSILEDHAVLDVKPDYISRYDVVRAADEVVIDLLGHPQSLGQVEARAFIATCRDGRRSRSPAGFACSVGVQGSDPERLRRAMVVLRLRRRTTLTGTRLCPRGAPCGERGVEL